MAIWRTRQFGEIRVRVVEYTAGYLADHWGDYRLIFQRLDLDGLVCTHHHARIAVSPQKTHPGGFWVEALFLFVLGCPDNGCTV